MNTYKLLYILVTVPVPNNLATVGFPFTSDSLLYHSFTRISWLIAVLVMQVFK